MLEKIDLEKPEKTDLPPVDFTDSAAKKVKSLIEEEEDPSLNLRVSIRGGGCSGFEYTFTFDPDIQDDDWVITKQAVKLLIDAISFQYLKGAEIDYCEDVSGARFVIRNPNAKVTCSCGSSFDVD